MENRKEILKELEQATSELRQYFNAAKVQFLKSIDDAKKITVKAGIRLDEALDNVKHESAKAFEDVELIMSWAILGGKKNAGLSHAESFSRLNNANAVVSRVMEDAKKAVDGETNTSQETTVRSDKVDEKTSTTTNKQLSRESSSQMLEAAKTASERALDVAKDVTKAVFEMAHLVKEYSQLCNEMTDKEAHEAFDEVKGLTARIIADAKAGVASMDVM